MSCEVIKELNEVTDFQLSRLIHFSKGTSTTNFKTARNSGCRSPISQVKTDSVSGKIHLLFPALGFLEAGLSF